MTDLQSRVAYLQGLSNGLDLSPESKEGKLFYGIIEVLGEFADSFDGLEEGQEQLEDYLETIDEDLYQLENELLDDRDMDHGIGSGNYIEVRCPSCGKIVFFDSRVTMDSDTIEITCPNCDEVVYINDESYQIDEEPEIIEGQTDNRQSGAPGEVL